MYIYTLKKTTHLGIFFYLTTASRLVCSLSTWPPILSIQSKNEIGGSADLTSEKF